MGRGQLRTLKGEEMGGDRTMRGETEWSNVGTGGGLTQALEGAEGDRHRFTLNREDWNEQGRDWVQPHPVPFLP